jgi:aspartyl-tRNA(Asn)/glutamyl-tRNA(Gln) amidotransferase subunit A
MPPLWQLEAAELMNGFGAGAFTPIEAFEACLSRTTACHSALNMMVTMNENARRAAEESQQRWARREPLGPLDGVPISVKDNLHVAQLSTSWGSKLFESYVAPRDEAPVASLRAAGAILFGKTNCPEFAMQGTTTNDLTGTTGNPWRPDLTPGGSSGGAAAAVAACCGPLALTTDGGGSTRRPASHTGLYGYKPSMGLVPRSGGLPEIFLDFEVVGAVGRSLRDVAAMTFALARRPLPEGAPLLRILFVPRFGSHPVDPGIDAEVRAAARRFEALGCIVEESIDFRMAERVNALWPALSGAGLAWMFEHAGQFEELLGRAAPLDLDLLTPTSRAALKTGQNASASLLFEVFAAVRELERELATIFSCYDAILTPATAALPWPANETHPSTIAGVPVGPRGHAVFTAFANAAGLPAIAVPSGFVNGLPTGFQIVGRRGEDGAVLALAGLYDQAHKWRPNWPDPTAPRVQRA